MARHDRLHFHGFPEKVVSAQLANLGVQGGQCQPSIRMFENILALPQHSNLFFPDGQAVPETAPSFVPRDVKISDKTREQTRIKLAVASPEAVAVPADVEVLKSPVLWGGAINAHYGHFLCESTSRLWALSAANADLPIVFTQHRGRAVTSPFVWDFFDALGIRDRIRVIERPTRFRSILCAELAIQHTHRLYSQFPAPHDRVSERLTGGDRVVAGSPIYLSRSAFKGTRSAGEAELQLEAELRARGVRILYPEQLSLTEQIRAFRGASAVIGLTGSALHTSLFLQPNDNTALVNLTWHEVNKRFIQFDVLKGNEAHYIHCCRYIGYREPVELQPDTAIRLMEESGVISKRTS